MKRFPCLEQPFKCYLTFDYPHSSSGGNDSIPQRLVVQRNLRLALTPQRIPRAAFWVLPCQQDSAYVLLKNAHLNNAYLRVDANNVATVAPLAEDLEFFQWKLAKKDGHFTVQSFHGKTLTSNNSNSLPEEDTMDFPFMVAEHAISYFTLEFLSGELLYLFSGSDHIRCDVLGQLAITETKKGWEVWRFLECGTSGKVKIASWMHDTRYLTVVQEEDDGGKEEGRVCTTTADAATEWMVELADSKEGVTLRTESGYFLALGGPGPSMSSSTEEREEDKPSYLTAVRQPTQLRHHRKVWQLQAAHSQRYSLIAANDGVSTVGPFPYVTRRAADPIRIESVDDDVVTLELQKQYVSVMENNIFLANVPFRWKMTMQEDGSYHFQTNDNNDGNDTSNGLYLSTKTVTKISDKDTSAEQLSEPDALTTTSTVEPTPSGAAALSYRFRSMVSQYKNPESVALTLSSDTTCSWRLDPCMPRAISSKKIKTFAAGTGFAVATTVAMPFAVAGVVGILGAEMGLLANVVVATLTGAEALASVGVVGATAAICFRQEADTLSGQLEGEDGEEEGEDQSKKYCKRPFCDWRMWT